MKAPSKPACSILCSKEQQHQAREEDIDPAGVPAAQEVGPAIEPTRRKGNVTVPRATHTHQLRRSHARITASPRVSPWKTTRRVNRAGNRVAEPDAIVGIAHRLQISRREQKNDANAEGKGDITGKTVPSSREPSHSVAHTHSQSSRQLQGGASWLASLWELWLATRPAGCPS